MAGDINGICAFAHKAYEEKDNIEKLRLLVSGVFGLLTNSWLLTEGRTPIST